ncbi:MAG: ATPase [Clostridia bacterium]|nr:ATPase [Clostridia bacterium]
MAIAKIKCLRIIGLQEKLYDVAETLVKFQSFQPDDPLNFHSDIKMFIPVQTNNPYGETVEKFNTALESCGVKCEITGISEKEFDENTAHDVDKLSDKLNEFADKKLKLESDIGECERNIEQIGHFLDLNLEIDKINKCRYVKANFGKLPKESFEKMQNYSDNPFVIFFPYSHDDDYYWGLYISPIANSDDVDRIFSGLYFESCGVLDLNGTPEQYYTEQKERLPKLRQELENLKAELDKFIKDNRDDMNYYHSYFTELQKRFDIMAKAVTYNKSFVIVGWVTADKAKKTAKALSKIASVECTLTNGKEELKHSPPVKLKNNFFTRGFEFYTEMYGLPNYSEFDPTTFIAVTYTILFGIMFGDLGHGLMVMLFGIFMKKKKNPLGSILIPCGISGALFGLVYGSVFGFEEALNPLYKALFGLDEKPISVMEPATTNTIIYLAVGIGILLVTLAIILNVIVSFKMNDKENAVFGNNGLAGLVFYTAAVAALVSQMMLGVKLANPLYVALLIAIPLVLIFLKEPLGKLVQGKKDWQPESWGGYCVQNFFELFEVLLSYVTNTMSFLRVGAFVLVHAGMMEVVFTLANMSSGFGYVAIVVIGNIFVMALEALLVCIQVLRLEFYEMFGRFYKGDGRAFKPVTTLAE